MSLFGCRVESEFAILGLEASQGLSDALPRHARHRHFRFPNARQHRAALLYNYGPCNPNICVCLGSIDCFPS